jgi:cytochrome P450
MEYVMPLPQALARAVFTPGFLAFKFSRRVRENPFRWYRLAQRIDPVHKSAFGVYVVSSHPAVTAALRSHALARSDAQSPNVKSALLRRMIKQNARRGPEQSALERHSSNLTIFRDPGQLPQTRVMLARALTPARIEAAGPPIQRFVDAVFHEAEKRGRIDIVEELADRIGIVVSSHLLGTRVSDEEMIQSNVPVLIAGRTVAPMRSRDATDQADRAAEQLTDYVSALVHERTRSPGEDLLSALIAANDEGMTHDELVATTLFILAGMHEGTPAAIGNGIHSLVRHPDQLARWHADPSIDESAIEELLRYDPIAIMTFRTAIQDAELEGRKIEAGSIVTILHGAANHDPKVFKEPWKLDLTRDPNPHVAFGNGPHYCPGAALARLQTQIVFSTFVRRFPNARLAPGGAIRRPGLVVRGFQKLEILTG